MTDVCATPLSPAAAFPSHPDHARWVKERTLAMEAEHAKLAGGAFRDAEMTNAKSLERLAAFKRVNSGAAGAKKGSAKEPRAGVRERQEERAAKGLTVKDGVAYGVRKSLCNFCGRCVNCAREARIIAIMAKAREGEQQMYWLTLNLQALIFAIQKRIDCKISPSKRARGKEIPFSRMTRPQAVRVFLAATAEICDWSVRVMGAWRP